MKVIKSIAKNFMHLAIGQGVAGLLYFVSMIYLARWLGPVGFGSFSFAEASFMFFLVLINLGIDYIGIKEVARNGDHGAQYIGRILPMKLILAFFSFAVLIIFSLVLPKPIGLRVLILIFGLALFPAALLLDWFFQGREKMSAVAGGLIARELVFLSGILLLRFLGCPLIWLGLVFLLARLSNSLVLITLANRLIGKIKLTLDLAQQKRILMDALPIGFSLIAGWVIYYFDTSLLVVLRGEREAGLFSASYKPVFFIIMATITYYKAVFPAMSQSYHISRGKLVTLVNGSIKLMAAIWTPAVIIGIILSRPLLRVLYGANFVDAAGALSWLLLSGLVMSINAAYQQGLMSSDAQKTEGKIAGILAASNIVLNFILIPRWGFLGAAFAKFAADLIVLPVYHYSFRRIRQ